MNSSLGTRDSIELNALIDWFKCWYGYRWELKTAAAAGLYARELSNVKGGFKSFSELLLPKLRRLKLQLETRASLAISARPRVPSPAPLVPRPS